MSQIADSKSSLPQSWLSLPIGHVSHVVSGGTPPSKDKSCFTNPGDGIPWLTPADLSNNKAQHISHGSRDLTDKGFSLCSAQILPTGSVLFSSRAPIGYVAIAQNPLSTNQGFKSFVLPKEIDSRFIYYQLRHLTAVAEALATGTTFKELSGSTAARIPIALAPTSEQRRIADKLDRMLARIDAANEHLSRVAPLIKRFRQSVLAAATSGRLTEDWRENKLQEWNFERADAICAKVQSGGTPKAGFSPQGIPFLKAYNIVNQRIDFDYKPQFVAQEVHEGELKKSITLPDDVLMNIVGPPLGKVAIVSSASPSWNINQAITLFRPSERILSKWIYIVLCEGAPIRDVLKSTKGSVGQVNISLSQCRAFSVPVPSIDEQTEIVRRVEKLFAFADRLEKRLSQAQAAVQKLTPALLAKAFRGELVLQDPNDEPASELLKRLQESRADSAKPSRARKPHARKLP